MPGFGGYLGEGKAGTQRRGGTRNGQTPPRLTGTWVQAEGVKGGSTSSQETVADAGTWRGVHGRAAEAGGCWVQVTVKWKAICIRRVSGERLKNDRASTMNGYGWGGGMKEGEMNNPEMVEEKNWGGRASLKV